jgi:micrococcal nuclease
MTRLFAAPAPLLALLFALPPAPAAAGDVQRAHFDRCNGSDRITCVVDGDTLWFEGEKIRLADINTPEVSQPACSYEAELGEDATQRLIVLLNAGPFSIEREGKRDKDRYGRLLRIVTRDGRSLGAVLIAEGLAETWQGRRGDWCTA